MAIATNTTTGNVPQRLVLDAFEHLAIPPTFIERYGTPTLWSANDHPLWPMYYANSRRDTYALWIFATLDEKHYTGVGIEYDYLHLQVVSRDGVAGNMQYALDNWEEVSRPFVRGGILPVPVSAEKMKKEQR